MLLNLAQEKHKPENALAWNFSTLDIERPAKLLWNGFFCNYFK